MRRREFIGLVGGAAVAWPPIALAQQRERVRLVCILEAVSADTPNAKARYTAFVEGLQQLGWTPGRNVQIEMRWGGGDQAATRKYAAELVALAPDVLVGGGGAATEVLLKVTHTIPIVFVIVPDPVGSGFVENLSRFVSARQLDLIYDRDRSRPVRGHSICGFIGRHRRKPNRLAWAGSD